MSVTRRGGVLDLGATELGLIAAGTVAVFVALRWAVAREPDPFIARVIVFGLIAKLIGSFARYTVMADLYDGRGDFNRYFNKGQELSVVIRSGSLPDQARELGTPFMDFIAGVVFAIVPARLAVGFLVFSLLAFIGAYSFFKAFQLAVPDGDHRRYALLIFFAPTMVFWPSSIGKEAWLVFGLGVASYGAARVLKGARFGYAILVLGGLAVYQVRPHMGALFALAFMGAFLLRFRDPEVRSGAATWMIGIVIVGAGTSFVYENWGDAVPRDESVEGSDTDQVFTETGRRTSQGGSAFDSRPVRTPIDFLHAAVTVPFRPFPMEANNQQAFIVSLEGLFLLGLVVLSLPRLRSLPRRLFRQPFVLMASAYCVGFIVAFSNVGNFGILTRQRAQLLPFIAVLLALPKLHQRAVDVEPPGPQHRRPPLLITGPVGDDPDADTTATVDDPAGGAAASDGDRDQGVDLDVEAVTSRPDPTTPVRSAGGE